MRRGLFLFLVCALLIPPACSKDRSKSDASPTPPQFIEDLSEKKAPVEASLGDAVTVEIMVFNAKYLVLDRDNPVEIYAPANTPFDFESNVFRIDPATRIYPVEVKFQVGPDAQYREYKLKLAMRVFFRNKADNVLQTRNALFEVPVSVVREGASRRKTHTYPMEYMLE